ncbi:amphi-Trp domain-containing protein [archaeon]|nr:amphi-Trp domain-containing protein [archaeon]
MEIKKTPSVEKKIIKGEFSQEFYMSRNELASFLRNLATQVEGEEDLKIISDEWILPFKSTGQAKVDIDLDEDELEIEIEFKKSTGKLITQPQESETEENPEYEHTYT